MATKIVIEIYQGRVNAVHSDTDLDVVIVDKDDLEAGDVTLEQITTSSPDIICDDLSFWYKNAYTHLERNVGIELEKLNI